MFLDKLKDAADLKLDDQVIANDALMGLKAAATAYLAATLEAATPELRRMFSEYMSQCVMAHEALTSLAVKRGWYQPYLKPDEQIVQAYQQSQWVLNPEA